MECQQTNKLNIQNPDALRGQRASETETESRNQECFQSKQTKWTAETECFESVTISWEATVEMDQLIWIQYLEMFGMLQIPRVIILPQAGSSPTIAIPCLPLLGTNTL